MKAGSHHQDRGRQEHSPWPLSHTLVSYWCFLLIHSDQNPQGKLANILCGGQPLRTQNRAENGGGGGEGEEEGMDLRDKTE